MKVAKLERARLEYEIVGEGEPVVFIHGAFLADMFRPLQAQAGVAEAYCLVMHQRRGYGGSSPATKPLPLAEQAEDCVGLLSHLGIGRAHVVGQSYGGAVALQLALDSPDVVHTLALIEPAFLAGDGAEEYRDSLVAAMRRYHEADVTEVVDGFMEARWPGYRRPLEAALPGAFDRAVAAAGTFFDVELPALLEWRFGETETHAVGQPALSVLGGASDALSPRFGGTHRLLLEWLPRAEGLIVPGASHLMTVEKPAEVARALVDFWRKHPMV